MVAASRVRNKELGISRPPSSWAIFVKEKHEEYQKVAKSQRLPGKTMSKKPNTSTLSKIWQEMTESAKAPFKIKANELAKANAGKRKAALADVVTVENKSLKPSVFEGKCFPWGLEVIQIQSTLGKGGYGEVQLGVTSVSNCRFAVKFGSKNPEDVADPDRSHDLLDERVLLQKVAPHPNILQYYGLVTHEDQVGLVLELGFVSLFDWLDENTLPQRPSETMISTRKQFFLQLAVALRHCHTRGVMHMDVKTNNMILCHVQPRSSDDSTQLMLKLADFGMAQAFSLEKGTLSVTPGQAYNRYYRPPECHTDDKKAMCGRDHCYNVDIGFRILLVAMRLAICNYSGYRCSRFCGGINKHQDTDDIELDVGRFLWTSEDLGFQNKININDKTRKTNGMGVHSTVIPSHDAIAPSERKQMPTWIGLGMYGNKHIKGHVIFTRWCVFNHWLPLQIKVQTPNSFKNW